MVKVVVVGGGFGGLAATRGLARNPSVSVTLLDQKNYHLFQPLLYQVATAGLSPSDIAFPIRSIFSDEKNVDVILAKVDRVDWQTKTVLTSTGGISYDKLILACGAGHSYFGHDEWEAFAPGLKTLEQATEVRRRVLLGFEMAERTENQSEQKKHLTFVIIGGGPTGVELAGAIAELSRFTLQKDFRRIDPSQTRVLLIEAGSRILSQFSAPLSRRAARDLEELGVQIWTQARVTGIKNDYVLLGQESIEASTILWAAGVRPSDLGQVSGLPCDPLGRVRVTPELNVLGHPDIYVIGDMAYLEDERGIPLPGLAPVALQQGKWVAQNILKDLAGGKQTPFRYFDRGHMATIGRRKAVMQAFGWEIGGFFAWVAWLIIHIYYLTGFKNRVFVFSQWLISYLTYAKGARLIVEKDWRLFKTENSHSEKMNSN